MSVGHEKLFPKTPFLAASSPVTLVVERCSGLAAQRLVDRVRALVAVSSHVTLCVTCERDAAAMQLLIEDSGVEPAGVRIAFVDARGPDVLPRCPLLATEHGRCPWSSRELMVPSESAWVPLAIRVPESGADECFGRELDALLDEAEAMHDEATWPTPRMQEDAWLNRRVAIELKGLGRYAVSRSASEVHRLVGWTSARLQARSAEWARRRRPLPSIRIADPTRRMRPSRSREQWQRRWQAALVTTAVRHRNILALSPWSILSDGSEERFELLTLLAHADVLYLDRHAARAANAPSGAEKVGRALAAALQQRQSLDQIAKHI